MAADAGITPSFRPLQDEGPTSTDGKARLHCPKKQKTTHVWGLLSCTGPFTIKGHSTPALLSQTGDEGLCLQ
ncbi:unnamed protein product [Gadus morhua 'NCC']